MEQIVETKLLYREREAARLLSMSPRKLWQLRRDKQIGFVRIGRYGVRYSEADLKAFISAQSITCSKEG